MRILAWTMAYWDSQEHADAQREALQACEARVMKYFRPIDYFLASGTWSDPDFNPLWSMHIVNAGAPKTKPNDPWWNYAACAITAAFAYALNRNDWDLLVCHDTDCLIGAVDFNALFREFLDRPELLLSDDWNGRPGSLIALKREGVARYQHQRLRPNLMDRVEGEPDPMLIEDELGLIFKGAWLNPWPQFPTLRQDWGQDSATYVGEREPLEKAWPFVRMPNPSIVEEYTRTQTSQAKPVLADPTVKA